MPDPVSCQLEAARGSIILHIVVALRIRIAPLRTVLAGLRVEIRWRIVRQAHDSKSVDKAGVWPVHAAEQGSAIARPVLAAGVWGAATE